MQCGGVFNVVDVASVIDVVSVVGAESVVCGVIVGWSVNVVRGVIVA